MFVSILLRDCDDEHHYQRCAPKEAVGLSSFGSPVPWDLESFFCWKQIKLQTWICFQKLPRTSSLATSGSLPPKTPKCSHPLTNHIILSRWYWWRKQLKHDDHHNRHHYHHCGHCDDNHHNINQPLPFVPDAGDWGAPISSGTQHNPPCHHISTYVIVIIIVISDVISDVIIIVIRIHQVQVHSLNRQMQQVFSCSQYILTGITRPVCLGFFLLLLQFLFQRNAMCIVSIAQCLMNNIQCVLHCNAMWIVRTMLIAECRVGCSALWCISPCFSFLRTALHITAAHHHCHHHHLHLHHHHFEPH